MIYWQNDFLLKFSLCFAYFVAASSLLATPKAEVAKKSWNFGTFEAKEKQTATFVIKNAGDAPLKLLKIRTTCGCSEVKKERDELKPGESGKITASIKSNGITGPFSKNFYVQTNDPKQRLLCLVMTGKALPLFEIKPKDSIYAGRLKAGKEWKREFIIVEKQLDGKNPSLEYGAPTVTGPHTFDVGLAEKMKDNKRLIILKVTPTKPGRFKSVITIPITSPSGWKPITLIISGTIIE